MAAAPDPDAEWWTTTDVAAYLGLRVGTVSSYRIRGQMPASDDQRGRTHVWRPARIIAWRPSPNVGPPETERDARPDLVDGTEFIEVSTATGNRKSAQSLARSAVEAKLAASAQIVGPVESVFWHLGKLGAGEEYRVVLKTTVERYPALEAHLIERHPWKNPEVVALPIWTGSATYLEWLRSVNWTTQP